MSEKPYLIVNCMVSQNCLNLLSIVINRVLKEEEKCPFCI